MLENNPIQQSLFAADAVHLNYENKKISIQLIIQINVLAIIEWQKNEYE